MAMGKTNMDRATGLLVIGELPDEVYAKAKKNLMRLARDEEDFDDLCLRLGLTA